MFDSSRDIKRGCNGFSNNNKDISFFSINILARKVSFCFMIYCWLICCVALCCISQRIWKRLKEGSNSQELQSNPTIGMAFRPDLYLMTERFAVSEFHLVLFLFRQPTKTPRICCCLHLKGLNSLVAFSSTSLSQAPLFPFL